MTQLALSVALSDNALTRPILQGQATPKAIEWTTMAVHPSELFWRQLHFGDFDVFEMSLSTCFRLASLDDTRWVALPVFTTRSLCHLSIVVTERSGIESPADLRGRRIGVPEYQQTSALWSRGVLERDFGVHPSEIEWVMERGESRSHGSATSFRPPEGVRLETMSESESIGQLLAEGRLDGSLLYLSERNLVDRSPALSHEELGIRPLFDPDTERARLTGRPLHANHCVAIRREIVERAPWAVLNVYDAFASAKEDARQAAVRALAPWAAADDTVRVAAGRVVEVDAAPYGLSQNEAMLEELADMAYRQGVATRPVRLDEVFARQALQT